MDTPSECSCQKTCSGSCTEDEGTVIELTHQGDSPWRSEEEMDTTIASDCSHTSTPSYKRGRHSDLGTNSKIASEQDKKIVQHILDKGIKWKIPKWISKHRRRSVQVLADAQVEKWPLYDNICQVKYGQGWKVREWIEAICAETIRLEHSTVILYLEAAMRMDFQPLKNVLQTLCKAIRQHQGGARIYMCNLLPRVTSSPLGRCIGDANFTVLQAVRSDN